jgi:hypothetical protein
MTLGTLTHAQRPAAPAAEQGPAMAEDDAPPPPGSVRRRATDDPASPLPKRGLVQAADALAGVVGSAMRYWRRSTDHFPETERLPAIDAATAELRRRVLETEAASLGRARVRLPRAWVWSLLAGVLVLLSLGVVRLIFRG